MMWKNYTENEWQIYAKAWLNRITDSESDNSQVDILMLNFMGSSEDNWKFIMYAFKFAKTDEELGHIAAGPLEHFIGKFGKDYIDTIEQLAHENEKFNRLLTGVWKHLTDDEVWVRIKILQKRIKNPLN